MSKHTLISTVAGLGLMAASLGANAQLAQTFDYSMMFYGAATGGGKYVAFVPTSVRNGNDVGAVSVLMLELFQPSSGSASTWAYAVGGTVGSDAGGVVSANAIAAGFDADASAYLHSLAGAIELSFAQNVVVSSQSCDVTFNAAVATDGQLRFADVGAAPAGALAATDTVSYTSGAGTATASGTIASAAWNAGSATLGTISGSAAAVGGLATNPVNSSAAIAAFTSRNKCVAAYTARALGGATVIGPTGPTMLGMTRVW